MSQKTVSFQNVFTDTKRAVLTNSPGNFQREADFFFAQGPKDTKQIFNKKFFATKNFYGHLASILDDPVEKLKTKGWNFSTQKVHKKHLQMKDCYPEGSYGHLGFSFDKPAKKLLPEGQKFWLLSENYGKEREGFQTFFSSLCSCGLVIWGFNDPAKLFLSVFWKIFAQVRNSLKN